LGLPVNVSAGKQGKEYEYSSGRGR